MAAKKTDKEVLAPLKRKSAAKGTKSAATSKATGNGKTSAGTGTRKPRKKRVEARVPELPAPKPPKFEKRFVAMARLMFLAKVTDKDIAASFGIDVETLEWWKEEHPDFGAAFRPDPRNYGGRPSDYDERYLPIANMLGKLGATDLEIAQAFEVSIRTIHRWKLQHPEFAAALQSGKDAIDDKVEASLLKRATGYSFDSEKIVVIEGEAQRVEIIEHVPPDTKAAMWWLQNRRPETWRDVRHIKHDVEKDGALAEWLDGLTRGRSNTVQPVEDDPDVGTGGTLPIIEDEEG